MRLGVNAFKINVKEAQYGFKAVYSRAGVRHWLCIFNA